MVFSRVDDPILHVQVDHGRLNIGVAQHGLGQSDGRAMFKPSVAAVCRNECVESDGRSGSQD